MDNAYNFLFPNSNKLNITSNFEKNDYGDYVFSLILLNNYPKFPKIENFLRQCKENPDIDKKVLWRKFSNYYYNIENSYKKNNSTDREVFMMEVNIQDLVFSNSNYKIFILKQIIKLNKNQKKTYFSLEKKREDFISMNNSLTIRGVNNNYKRIWETNELIYEELNKNVGRSQSEDLLEVRKNKFNSNFDFDIIRKIDKSVIVNRNFRIITKKAFWDNLKDEYDEIFKYEVNYFKIRTVKIKSQINNTIKKNLNKTHSLKLKSYLSIQSKSLNQTFIFKDCLKTRKSFFDFNDESKKIVSESNFNYEDNENTIMVEMDDIHRKNKIKKIKFIINGKKNEGNLIMTKENIKKLKEKINEKNSPKFFKNILNFNNLNFLVFFAIFSMDFYYSFYIFGNLKEFFQRGYEIENFKSNLLEINFNSQNYAKFKSGKSFLKILETTKELNKGKIKILNPPLEGIESTKVIKSL